MTPEQKFFFDLKGWILLPAVLSPSDIVKMKAEVYDGAQRGYEGALQELLDHPVIVGILNDGASIIPQDEFPTITDVFFKSFRKAILSKFL